MKTTLRSPAFYLPLILVIAAGIIIAWFLHSFEKKEYTVRQGMSPQAIRNPLLAAERFLNLRGITAVSQKGMDRLRFLPPAGDTILIRRMPAMVSQEMSDEIFTWVERGGHLVMVPADQKSDHPGSVNLLDELNVEFLWDTGSEKDNPESDENGEKHGTEDDSTLETDYIYEPHDRVIDLTLDQVPLSISVRAYRLLDDKGADASFWIPGSHRIVYTEPDRSGSSKNLPDSIEREGDWLLQYSIGEGKITILSELTPFTNEYIGNYDNGCLLEWLLQDSATVWILFSNQSRSLTQIVTDLVPRFCLAALVLFILMLWRMQKRSGSLMKTGQEEQPNIMVHIEAVGQFNWRQDRLASMLASNRSMLLTRLSQRYLGHTCEADNESHIPAIAQKSDIPITLLHDGLVKTIENEQDLINVSRAMLRIHGMLHSYTKEMN